MEQDNVTEVVVLLEARYRFQKGDFTYGSFPHQAKSLIKDAVAHNRIEADKFKIVSINGEPVGEEI